MKSRKMDKLPNFIYIALCDNDFGADLEKAVKIVWEALGNKFEKGIFERCVIEFTCSFAHLHDAYLRIHSDVSASVAVSRYLKDNIAVQYVDRKSDLDHDGGSVVIDCNTGYVWRY